nr:hypothetical protein [Tanacetum cinerariifolium]
MASLEIKCTRHSHYQVKCSHWQYKFPLPVKVVATARRLEIPLPKVCTAIEEKKKKLPVKDRWQEGRVQLRLSLMVDFIAASPLRIETTDEGTHILATVDGIQRTVSESFLRRNLKLRDEDGIVSIQDTELFKNLTLMGPKSIGFNEFSSNIATALVCLATNRTYNYSKMIFDDEPASPVRDVSEGEACPADSGFIADQDKATIAKSSTLPHDSAPRVTSPAVDEGNSNAHQERQATYSPEKYMLKSVNIKLVSS